MNWYDLSLNEIWSSFWEFETWKSLLGKHYWSVAIMWLWGSTFSEVERNLLLKRKRTAHIYIQYSSKRSLSSVGSIGNNIWLQMYFKLHFTPKRRTKKSLTMRISGP